MTKFLCDQMCAELGKWLRAAGYDTIIASPSIKDEEIFKQAVEEDRLLLTRDRDFTKLDPKRKTVVFFEGESLDDWVWQLKNEGCDFLYRPFSRCLKCNAPLNKIPPPSNLPQLVRERVKEFWNCPLCHQNFWQGTHTEHMENQLHLWGQKSLRIGFGGDLMIGRLVDEMLERMPFSYIWGNLHSILRTTDFNIVNLETTLTQSEKIVPKAFNFKAAPGRVKVLVEGPIHAVNLANNHILDFSEEGLMETIRTLDQAGIFHVGAGENLSEARSPCILEKKGIKVGLLGGTDNEPTWKATASHPGTNYLEMGDLNAIREQVIDLRKNVDILVLSVHWGPNMRQKPSNDFRKFAHALIDLGVDIIHGHSAHVFQGVEIYKEKLIIYDAGELMDDYAVDPELRNDRSFFFIVEVEKKQLLSVKMIPTLISRFQVNISKEEEHLKTMEELCAELKTRPIRQNHHLLFLPFS